MNYIGVDLGCSAEGKSASSAVAVLGPESVIKGSGTFIGYSGLIRSYVKQI